MSEFRTPVITPDCSDTEGLWPSSTPITFGRQDSFRRSLSRQNSKRRSPSCCKKFTPSDILLEALPEKDTKVTLTWSNLSCFAPEYKKGFLGQKSASGSYKQLLYNLNGAVQPGTMLALMGASGAGKTTLLNTLTCRARNLGDLLVDGSVKVNGVSLGPKIKFISAYVEQMDLFFGSLTVREHLIYSATLRMGDKGISAMDIEKRVDEVMHLVGLDRCSNSFVMDNGNNGISGSEKKLLSIGSEILVDQPLMFCDEPTTGLDATMAKTVTRILRQMTKRGKTVICTIHQPSSQIFELFDRIILLGEGKQVFQGSLMEADDFFTTTLNLPCPKNYNPADHYIHALAIRPKEEERGQEFVSMAAEKFRSTTEYSAIQNMISKINENPKSSTFEQLVHETQGVSSHKASWWAQVKIITWKQTVSQFRNPRLCFFRILQCFLQALIISILYFQQDYTQYGVVNINGASYMLILQMTNMALIQMGSFCSEMQMFYREHENGLYGIDSFFLAKNISELPIFVIMIGMTATMGYWSIGMYPDIVKFLLYLFVFALVYHSSLSVVVYTVGLIAERPDLALSIATPMRMSFSLLSGYWVNDASVPIPLTWWRYLSWHWYSYRFVVINQWIDVKTIDCVAVDGNSEASGCYSSGQDVINFLNFQEINTTTLLLILFGLVVAFRLLPFGMLVFKTREKKFKNKK